MSDTGNNTKKITVCVTGEYDEATKEIKGGDDVKITVGDTNGDTSFTGDDAVNDALKQLKLAAGTSDGTDAGDAGNAAVVAGTDAAVGKTPRTVAAERAESDAAASSMTTSGVNTPGVNTSSSDTQNVSTSAGMTESPTAVAIKNAQKKKAKDELAAAKAKDDQDAIKAAEEKLANLTAAGGGRTRAKRRPKRTGTKKKKRTKRLRKKGRKTKKC